MLRADVPATEPEVDVTDPVWWTWLLEQLGAAGLKLLSIVLILIGCLVAGWLLRLIIRRVVRRIVLGAKNKANVDDTQALDRGPLAQVRVVQRTRTLGSILQNIVNIALVLIALVLIVQVVNEQILGSLTLLTAAVGAGLGFGAQNIVKDVLNGIFIVAEDQVGIGDVVDVGLATGIVEYVSIRITHVRDVNGTLWYVRNGEITRIGNLSQGWSRIIVDVSVPGDADLDAVETAMLEAAETMRAEKKWRSRILEAPQLWGLEAITGETLVVRIVMRTRASAKDDVAAALRVRLKDAVEAIGVPIPEMATVHLEGLDGAHRVRGARPPQTEPTPLAPTAPGWARWRAKRRDPQAEGGADTGDSPAPGKEDRP